MKSYGDSINRRLEAWADSTGTHDALSFSNPWGRYSIDPRWISFECGCSAERVAAFAFRPERWDPVIFEHLPEQALYATVCSRHLEGMNGRLRFGGFVDFEQWRRHRRNSLLGRSR
jgi:hypothetical protein